MKNDLKPSDHIQQLTKKLSEPTLKNSLNFEKSSFPIRSSKFSTPYNNKYFTPYKEILENTLSSCKKKTIHKNLTPDSSISSSATNIKSSHKNQNIFNIQATLKTQEKSLKPIYRCKQILEQLKLSNTQSISTQSSSISSLAQTLSSFTDTFKDNFNTSQKLKSLSKSPTPYEKNSYKNTSNRSLSKFFKANKTNNEYNFIPKVYFSTIKKPRMLLSNCCAKYFLEGCTNSINCILEQGGNLLTGDSSCIIKSWSLPSTSQNLISKNPNYIITFLNSHIITQHKKPIMSLEKLNDTIISASKDGKIKLIKNSTKNIKCISANPGVNIIKIIQSPKLITLGVFIEFKDLIKNKDFRDSININPTFSLAIQSENTFITGSNDGYIKLWDIRTSRFVSNNHGHYDKITGLAMSTGCKFFTCSDDKMLKEWDLRSNQNLKVRKSEKGLKDVVIIGDFVVTGGDVMTLWNDEGFEDVEVHKGSVKSIYYCYENEMIFSAGFDGRICAFSFSPIL
ncbi:hypothetical protein SteCoe_16381 [Stentor coeruleus]|uniref:Uncharacterized protein n=1 Tax=Stentor coeruleus TaxID=5963 RepID=A0A1R2C1E9_9CILI|nr:hypothetical protein SteCoe_16381 [Stentor coeruleus]